MPLLMSVLNAQARIVQNFQYVRLNNLSQTWPARSHKVSPTKSLGFHHPGEEQLRWEHWIQEECAVCTLNHPQPEVIETIEHHWNEEAMFPCSTLPCQNMTSEHAGRLPGAFPALKILKLYVFTSQTLSKKEKFLLSFPGVRWSWGKISGDPSSNLVRSPPNLRRPQAQSLRSRTKTCWICGQSTGPLGVYGTL